MERLERYKKGYKDDFILNTLQKNGVDIERYLNGGYITDIVINKKEYKIFYAKNKSDIENAVLELERKKIKTQLRIESYIGSLENNKKKQSLSDLTRVLQEITEGITITGDIVFDGKTYKEVPERVGKPTEKIKESIVKARITGVQLEKLNKYCSKNNMTISEALRDLIEKCDTK